MTEVTKAIAAQMCRAAKAERAAGGSVEINHYLPYVGITLSTGANYVFWHQEASALLDEVPENVNEEDYILWSALGW